MDAGTQLLALGHDVRFLSQNELPELAEPFLSRTFVVNDQRVGWMEAVEFTKHGIAAGLIDGTFWPDGWTAEAVLCLGDVYTVRAFAFSHERDQKALMSVPSFHYVPVEGTDLPPSWKRLWDILSPIAMSKFGAAEIAKVTGTLPPVVYHGVDQETFHPVSVERPIQLGALRITNKTEARRYFGIPPDIRLCLRTDANAMRKLYPSLFRSMEPVLAARPDAWLLYHCRSADEYSGDLRDILSKIPVDVRKRIYSTGVHDKFGAGYDRSVLSALYNAADVYTSVSAEGFGLTIAEALACGVPAVGIDYSAVPEVIGPAGFTVPVSHLIDNPYSHFWAQVDEERFGTAVGRLLDNPKERRRLGAKGPGHVAANFSWRRAAEQFVSIIESHLSKAAA